MPLIETIGRIREAASDRLEVWQICHVPARAPITFRTRLHRSTILFVLGLDHAFTVLFLITHTRTSQWVTHPEIALAAISLNFGVPIESEASDFPKSLMLDRDENIHIRLTRSTLLGDVRCHNPPP
ncbi:hypothetical protein DVH24_010799 [Malus domestica]|uniref:Uncharacterized protein n=1 Tax=Malus domestica TaxID=3750 RepID=A0A498JXH0_MALDO|nr:hypothetical protein DVH24_010799 [Malus domestica]